MDHVSSLALLLRYRKLEAGDPAPWFCQLATCHPKFDFSSLGGRYILLGFFGSASDDTARAQLKLIEERAALFDDANVCFFGVSADTTDQSENRLTEVVPGQRHFWDFDRTISKLYGATAVSGQDNTYRRFWVLIDPTLRVMKTWPMVPDAVNLAAILDMIAALPPPGRFAGPEIMAPVLYLPNVVPPDLCQQLVKAYEAGEPQDSGFMREENGLTKVVQDHGFKRRRDFTIEDEATMQTLRMCVHRRLRPEILKAFQFDVTRMERYIVACYTAEDGGHFRPHRDNTTKGTAHRKFAVSINLNDDFDGGDLTFPEYGPRSFRPPVGGAVVFSCSLLHTVSKVTRGRRYAFLPFLYDDAAARLREANNAFLDSSVTPYTGSE
jgi:peroxiredoxin